MANDGTVKIGVNADSKGFAASLSKLGGIAKTALAGVAAATGAASAAIGKLAKDSLEAYGNYEQLIGGVETLFKDSAGAVEEYANNAYKTAGLSANQYMETVTGFSASLLQSLGGDTAAAADIADQAIIDMADNANKMGSSMESIQNAYQGFAKQNYTMLDNLKLGYGGTKAEMERLLADAEQISGIHFDISSFADVVQAIHVIQEDLGITGTTAEEAASTIQGSLASMGAAWQNLVTGIADENAELDTLIDNFVESVATAADNILPRLEQILSGIGELVEKLAPIIAEHLPQMIASVLPSLLSAGAQLVEGLIIGITSALPTLVDAAVPIVLSLAEAILGQLPAIADASLQIIITLANGLADAIPSLSSTIVDVVLQIIDTLTDSDTLIGIADAALEIIVALARGLADAIPELISEVPGIIASIITVIWAELPSIVATGIDIVFALIDGIIGAIPELVAAIPNLIIGILGGILENLDKIILAAPQIIFALIEGILGAIPALLGIIPDLFLSISDAFLSVDWGSIGSRLVDGILGGFEKAWNDLVDWVQSKIDELLGTIGSLLGFGGKTSGSGSASSPRGSSRTASPTAVPMSISDEESVGGVATFGLTRARAVTALASAMPEAQSRVAIATASMAPAAGYSAPPATSGQGSSSGGGQQAPFILRPNWTIRFDGDNAQLGRVLKPIIDSEDNRMGQGV